ncbi:MAG TPA: hypothetical protein DIU15_07035, partial [Deltaproteobacteria bacterium]|nr:hypothetical protein [Deltaproteobacteria bacterium]
YRIQGTFLSDFPVDAEGTMLGQAAVLDQRIRVAVAVRQGRFRLGTEWDLLTGQLAGDLWDIPGEVDDRHRHKRAVITPDGFVPRRFAVRLDSDLGQLEAGLVTSHWGLGMLANDGDQDLLFGRTDFGDRVLRLRGTTRPFAKAEGFPGREHVYLTAAADMVLADDMAQIADGQIATQAILSVLYRPPDARRLGVYLVHRHQDELADDRSSDLMVIDGFGVLPVALGATGWTLELAVEAAGVLGRTDRSLSYNERQELEVRAAGVAARATFRSQGDALQVHVRGGWASGDKNPDDAFLENFTFDRDFDVGLILFDQVLGGIDAAAHALLVDPEHSGAPPDGVDSLATEGAFRRAMYVQPVVQVVPFRWLDLRGGLMFAGSSAPVQHPFYSFRAGGMARNHHDFAPNGGLLGSELDWAVRVGGQLPWGGERAPSLALRVQGGHLFLGGALQGGTGDIVHQVLISGLVGW